MSGLIGLNLPENLTDERRDLLAQIERLDAKIADAEASRADAAAKARPHQNRARSAGARKYELEDERRKVADRLAGLLKGVTP